jgi:hypothetical protein
MATAPPSRLTVELEFYEAHKADWLKGHRDEYVVVKGNVALGFFVDFQKAYRTGVEKYGIDCDFLVKRIVPQEPVFLVF